VAPPDFAPQISHITTLYDICVEVAVNKGLIAPPQRPSFKKQIYPILSRVCALQWVNKLALLGHGPGAGDGTRAGLDLIKYLPQLSDNGAATQGLREQVFAHLRDPNADVAGETAMSQANMKFMPPLSGDSGDATTWQGDYAPDDPFIPETWLTITKLQYAVMEKWAAGDFDSDWGSPSEAPGITAEGLDRAALEATVGGAFFPGIEAGWVMRNPSNYMDKEAFRLDQSKLSAGDVSQHMACPWQADFYECNTDWWPAQRPDDVLTEEALQAIVAIEAEISALDKDDAAYQDNLRHLNTRKSAMWLSRDPWTRGFPDNDYSNNAYSHAGDESMVDDWHHLGFVVNKLPDGSTPTIDGEAQFVETERYKYVTGMAESFHCLLNPEEFPAFVPRAKELALQFLADAKFEMDPSYSEFTYTEEAFRARLDKIYNDFVDQTMNEPLWTETGDITWTAIVDYDADGEPVRAPRHYNVGPFSNKAIKERILQGAPFNLIDGSWLQNIMKTGPADEVHARLFSIWSDEAGNGLTELNHCNVYDTLLRGQNIYVPPVSSKEFIKLDFIKSAFDGSVIQLAVGMFPDEFLPELLGMTLYLEWEATPTLTPIVKAYQSRNIDPHFYRMHVAIDNISEGHGALVREAIEIYLQARYKEGGDEVVQTYWRRIWRGYVAWATAGFAGNELLERMLLIDRKTIYIQSSLLSETDIKRQFVLQLKHPVGVVSQYLRSNISAETIRLLDSFPESDQEQGFAAALATIRAALKKDINAILRRPGFWDAGRFKGITLSAETLALINHNPTPVGVDLIDLNRWLLEDAFPLGISRKTPFPDINGFYRSRMRDLIVNKAPVAKNGVHDSVMLNGKPLAKLFDDPDQLLDTLANSALINIQHSRQSAFFDRLDFSGPMYKVFTTQEQNVILDWIESLGIPAVPTAPPQPSPSYPDDPAAAVLQILSEKINIGLKVAAHSNYPVKAGGTSKSVLDWMKDGPSALMNAIRQDPGWINPGSPDSSKFFNFITSGPMSGVFDIHQQDFFRRWIAAGANMPSDEAAVALDQRANFATFTLNTMPIHEIRNNLEARARQPHVKFVSYQREVNFAERRRHIGMGSVH
jgi:L-lysine epsilon oxidase-like protein/heme oxygenase-like protein